MLGLRFSNFGTPRTDIGKECTDEGVRVRWGRGFETPNEPRPRRRGVGIPELTGFIADQSLYCGNRKYCAFLLL